MKTIIDKYDTYYAWKLAHPCADDAYKFFFDALHIMNSRCKMLQDRVEALEAQITKMHGSTSKKNDTVLPCAYCGENITGLVTYVHGEQACVKCSSVPAVYYGHQEELFP